MRQPSSSCSQVFLVYLQSPSISSQFTLEICSTAENCKKTLKPHIFGHGLSPAISLQFNVEMCAGAKNCEKNSPKPLFWGFNVVQSHRR